MLKHKARGGYVNWTLAQYRSRKGTIEELFRLLGPFCSGFILLKEPVVASVEGGVKVGSFNL
jgi:hypothetical protein